MSQIHPDRLSLLPAAIFLSLLSVQPDATAQAPTPSQPTPFAIVKNDGQWHDNTLFRRQRGSATAWFVRDGWVLDLGGRKEAAASLEGSEPGLDPRATREDRSGVVIAMRFEGASPQTQIQPAAKLGGYYNFLRGRNPNAWHTRVPGFQELRYRAVYPGIDAVVRAGRGLFAYDLHVAPAARLSKVVFRCEGMRGSAVDADGSLVLQTPLGELRQSAPIAWQVQPDGRRTTVTARFVERGEGRFGFEVIDRDKELPLIIDPDLTWASYFGGTDNERVMDVARTSGTGASAKIVVSGGSQSNDFPTTTGAYQTTSGGIRDGFVSHVDPSKAPASQLIWSTYIGGNAADYFFRAKADGRGQITAVGFTTSTDYPVAGKPLKTKLTGAVDGCITTLNPSGTALVFSTLWGGSSDDWICDVAIQPSSAITVVGLTTSVQTTTTQGLPVTTNCFQSTFAGGLDAFISRIQPGLTSPVYSTYLGGTGLEGMSWVNAGGAIPGLRGISMDLDTTGRVLVTGTTLSAKTFPTTTGALQTASASPMDDDVFVSLIDPSKVGTAQLVYSTYLGGGGRDTGMACAFADKGRLCVAGGTGTASFPTTVGAYDRTAGTTGSDWFVTWLDPARTGAAQLSYSTRMGSSSTVDLATGLFIDDCGVANLTGAAASGFPVTAGAFQKKTNGIIDAIFARLAPTGLGSKDLIYSTRYGGSGASAQTYGFSCAPDGAGGAFFAGWTDVGNLPTPNGRTSSGGWEGYAAHVWGLNAGVTHVGQSTPPACAGDLLLGARGAPTRGNSMFGLAAWNAGANATGFLGLGFAIPNSIPLCGATLEINPFLVLAVTANARGEWSTAAPIALATPLGTKLSVQTIWNSSACCLTASNALAITVK